MTFILLLLCASAPSAGSFAGPAIELAEHCRLHRLGWPLRDAPWLALANVIELVPCTEQILLDPMRDLQDFGVVFGLEPDPAKHRVGKLVEHLEKGLGLEAGIVQPVDRDEGVVRVLKHQSAADFHFIYLRSKRVRRMFALRMFGQSARPSSSHTYIQSNDPSGRAPTVVVKTVPGPGIISARPELRPPQCGHGVVGTSR
jgi:hypothetical protein